MSDWRVRLAAAAAVLLALILAGRAFGDRLPLLVEWVRDQGVWGPALFVLGYAVATVALVPGSLLTLAAGAVFGLGLGVLVVLLGATLGAAAAFLIARYLARPVVEQRVARDPRFGALDRAVGQAGRRIVFLLRLSPVFPFSLLNYALGLTRVRFVDYLVASIGMLPGTLLYVYYGKLAGDVATLAGGAPASRGGGYWVVLGLGLTATLVVTVTITRIARRTLAAATGTSP